MIGFIYVLSNEAMPGLVKIGLTVDTPESRAKSLFSSGVPLPFRVEFYASVNDCLKVERAIHEDMARFRLHDGREFFTVSVDEAIQAVTRQVDLFNAEASLSFIETPKSLHDLLRERVLQSENRSEVARQAGITYPALRSFLSGSDVKSSTFRRIANAVGLKLVLRKVGSMALPFVQFTSDSETAVGCASYIARAVIAGELVSDASSDLPGSILVVARVAHSVAEQLSGRILFGAQQEAVASEFEQVGAAFGLDAAKLGGPLSSLFLKLLLQKLLEAITESILPQACPCDDDYTNDDCCDETPATTPSAEVVTETSDAGTREDS